jgi:hypothetical protein
MLRYSRYVSICIVVCGIEPKATRLLSKLSTTEPQFPINHETSDSGSMNALLPHHFQYPVTDTKEVLNKSLLNECVNINIPTPDMDLSGANLNFYVFN